MTKSNSQSFRTVIIGNMSTSVHQAIEDLHQVILDDEKVTKKIIPEDFETNNKGFHVNGYRTPAEQSKHGALRHCLNYYINTKDLLNRVIEIKIYVSYEKDMSSMAKLIFC